MKNASQDKMEEARIAREREMEMLMVARSQAIEEEELERAAEEQERRSVKKKLELQQKKQLNIKRLILAVSVKTNDNEALVTLELTLNEVTGNSKNCIEHK